MFSKPNQKMLAVIVFHIISNAKICNSHKQTGLVCFFISQPDCLTESAHRVFH
jgi:hypothetical protein